MSQQQKPPIIVPKSNNLEGSKHNQRLSESIYQNNDFMFQDNMMEQAQLYLDKHKNDMYPFQASQMQQQQQLEKLVAEKGFQQMQMGAQMNPYQMSSFQP